MPEDLIKAKIVFEGGGIAGAIGGGGGVAGSTSGGTSDGVLSRRGMMKAVTLPITDVLGGILNGIKKMGEFSPMLGAEFIRLRKGLQLILMPIGDAVANWLRPMAQGWIETASVFYESYKSGGFWTAMSAAMAVVWDNLGWVDEDGTINFTGILENVEDLITIAAVLTVGAAILGAGFSTVMSMIGGGLGLSVGAAGAGVASASGLALWIPAALFLVSKLVGDALGLEGSGIIAMLATAAGIGITTAAGVAVAWSIPIALSLVGVAAFVQAAGDALAEIHPSEPWGGPDITDPETGLMNQDAINAAILRGDLLAGTTVGMRVNELTGEMELVTQSAEQMSDDIYNHFQTSDEFAPMKERLAQMVSDSFDSTNETSLGYNINQTTLGAEQDFVNLGTEINTENNLVLNLIQTLIGLPNIFRTITYTIRYRRES